MIPAIDALLSAWGKWAEREARRSVGYPSTSPMFKDAPRNNVYGSGMPVGVAFGSSSEMEAIDGMVNRLPMVHRVVVITHYQHADSFRESSRINGLKRGLLSKILGESHEMIDSWLHGSQNAA